MLSLIGKFALKPELWYYISSSFEQQIGNGEKLVEEERTSEGKKTWSVRPYTGDSFNEYIDREEDKESKELYIKIKETIFC